MRLRGWTLDVLRLIRGIGSAEFDLNQVYSFEGELSSLHPNNLNIRPKIRQQLQVLRDLGFVQFLGRGTYVLKS
ncbi:MAG: Dam-replacing domain protein [Tepidisphaeraceae bacterium]